MEDDNTKKSILPNDVIIDILLFLLIKSLMRFRCVNKTWLRLLTNDHPHFAQSYLSKSNKNKTTILALGMEEFQDKTKIYSAVELSLACDKAIDLELPFSAKSYFVGGIRNGLILLRIADVKNKLFIWNPFTNDYIHIPYHLHLLPIILIVVIKLPTLGLVFFNLLISIRL
ncbi:hypothetical protein AQUCO_02600322v1 [Aquilegia coerulea]|uniref:F-box domain-containing protein n=1 Tax=Aquilegia coerulea TaxID=218851 RepID=A0A2G5D8C0_AQUCA|nr:hypothetical protein AQUCO_02600322v1 [Aquilegia coerulea]